MKRLTPLMCGLVLAFGIPAAMAQAPGAPAQGAPTQGGAPAAQSAPGQAPTTQPAPARASFSDEEIENFVEVQPEIEEIRADYSERLVGVTDQEEAAELQSEALEKMVRTVEKNGLDVDTYNSIAFQALKGREVGAGGNGQLACLLNILQGCTLCTTASGQTSGDHNQGQNQSDNLLHNLVPPKNSF